MPSKYFYKLATKHPRTGIAEMKAKGWLKYTGSKKTFRVKLTPKGLAEAKKR